MNVAETTFAARTATPADYALFARLFPELGVSDPLPTPAQFAERMLPRVLVVDDGDAPVGYAFWQVYGRTAHVVHVVVDPAARGRRVGGALMDAVRVRVRAEGCTRWYLNVKQDNEPAIRLYQRSGLAIELEGWALDVRWDRIDGLPGAPSSAQRPPFVPPPGDDPVIGKRLDVPVERIALLRGRAGVVLLALPDEDGALPAAFAAFDPAFPGIHPLRVAHLELARPLLRALREHARHDSVHVFVEGDRPLYEALRALGAELRHAIYRMGAEIVTVGDGDSMPRRRG